LYTLPLAHILYLGLILCAWRCAGHVEVRTRSEPGSTLRSGPLRPGPRTCKCGSSPPSHRTEPRTCGFSSVWTSVRISPDRTMDSVHGFGYPRNPQVPIPIPIKTRTRAHGYGFQAGVGAGTRRVTHGLPVTGPNYYY